MKYYADEVDDSRIEAALQAVRHICGWSVEDGIPTGETLDDWRKNSQKWRQLDELKEKQLGEFSALLFLGAQAFKGQRRSDIVVLDLGAFRAVFTA
jgi:hypothetical protein